MRPGFIDGRQSREDAASRSNGCVHMGTKGKTAYRDMQSKDANKMAAKMPLRDATFAWSLTPLSFS